MLTLSLLNTSQCLALRCVFDVQDRINGRTLCGCDTIAACQAGAPMGACKDIGAPNRTTSPSVNGNSYSGTIEFKIHSNSAASNTNIWNGFVFLLRLQLSLLLLFSAYLISVYCRLTNTFRISNPHSLVPIFFVNII